MNFSLLVHWVLCVVCCMHDTLLPLCRSVGMCVRGRVSQPSSSTRYDRSRTPSFFFFAMAQTPPSTQRHTRTTIKTKRAHAAPPFVALLSLNPLSSLWISLFSLSLPCIVLLFILTLSLSLSPWTRVLLSLSRHRCARRSSWRW